MKLALCLTLCLLVASNQAMAECQVTASQPKLAYGWISPAERQMLATDKITLMEKRVVLHAICNTPSRIRLFISSHSANGSQFSFGSQGAMQVTASQAFLDNRSVKLSKVHTSSDAVVEAGQSSVSLSVNDGLAFVDGSEITASQASVILTVTPEFKNEAITDTTEYTGHIRVRVEAQ